MGYFLFKLESFKRFRSKVRDFVDKMVQVDEELSRCNEISYVRYQEMKDQLLIEYNRVI